MIFTTQTIWRVISIFMLLIFMVTLGACTRRNWAEAHKNSAGIAPLASEYDDAVVMAFRARTWGFRGIIADHTWIATKHQGADSYKVYEVIGWRRGNGQKVVRIRNDVPDRFWFGAQPIVMTDIRGPEARELVNKVEQAVDEYPYAYEYRVFPGPNSNTFTAWVAKQIPELNLELPFRAIGKDYI